VKIGLAIQNYGTNPSREFLKRVALEVEKQGLDSIWTSDHIIVRKKDKPWTRVFDSLTTLTYFASMTENVMLGTSVLLAALRDPLVVGKQIATLDSLSGGRLVIGVGIGWNKSEFDILEKDFDNRAKTTEKSVKQWKKLWSGGFETEGFLSEPLPHQKGGPPILVGGQSKSAIKRVALFGDGWHPVGIDSKSYQKGVEEITNLRKHNYIWSLRIAIAANKTLNPHYTGTDGAPRVRLVGNLNQIIDQLEQYKKVGVQHLACDVREKSIEEYLEQVKVLAELKKVFSKSS